MTRTSAHSKLMACFILLTSSICHSIELRAVESSAVELKAVEKGYVESEDRGFSGMVKVNEQTYLVVHDTKSFQEGNRIGKLRIESGQDPAYSPIKVKDWQHAHGRSNDLESICALPNTASQYLIAESGYRQGKFGRIFHINLHEDMAQVINTYQLPKIQVNNRENPYGDNFEGMVCTEHQGGVLLILGERGGSLFKIDGTVQLGLLDLKDSTLSWKQDEEFLLTAPGHWNKPDETRSISDLYLDSSGIIWASATVDNGDDGPFRSIIYRAARIDSSTSGSMPYPTVTLSAKLTPAWIIDGFKVEAVSGPSAEINDSFMSFATEDENLSGIWRPLSKPVS